MTRRANGSVRWWAARAVSYEKMSRHPFEDHKVGRRAMEGSQATTVTVGQPRTHTVDVLLLTWILTVCHAPPRTSRSALQANSPGPQMGHISGLDQAVLAGRAGLDSRSPR